MIQPLPDPEVAAERDRRRFENLLAAVLVALVLIGIALIRPDLPAGIIHLTTPATGDPQ
jgi:hypothetical protein